MKRRTFIKTVLFSPLAVVVFYKEGVAKPVIDANAIAEAIKQTMNQITSLGHEVEMITNQVTQISQMAQHLVSLPESMINSIMTPFNEIKSAVDQLQGIGNSLESLTKSFDSVYSTSSFGGSSGSLNWGSGTAGGSGISDKIAEWRKETEQKIKNIFEITPKLQKSATDQIAAVQKSLEQSNNAPGILQAAQAGNEINGTIVQQLHSIQVSLETMNGLMATIAAQQLSQERTYPEVVKKFFGTGSSN